MSYATAKEKFIEFLGWVKEFEGKDMLYRGLYCESYYVTASLTRRFFAEHDIEDGELEEEEINISQESLIDETEKLVEDARMHGHGVKDGRELTDLEILAELQHYDAATCLLDFTRNPLIALWFACRGNRGTEGMSGKVVAFDMGNKEICSRINRLEQLKKPIGQLLSSGENFERKNENMFCAWAPHHQNRRITAQQSVFVFGKPRIDWQFLETRKIVVDGIHKELENLGISQDSLFCDFHGFARNRTQNHRI